MAKRRVVRFAYHTPVRKGRREHPFQMRDGDGALYLTDKLVDLGYRYHGPIFNYPSRGGAPRPFDESRFRPDDLILLTTRPPIHDYHVGDRKGIKRSFTSLEERLFSGPIKQHLERSARSEIVLSDATARISPEIGKRQSIVFRQNGGAMYESYGSPATGDWKRFKKSDRLTAVFLIYAEHAWPDGPGLLAAFGLGGTETLVWCRLLATRFADLLCSTPFAMAEMRTGPWPDRPESMDFADDWPVTLLGAGTPVMPPGSSFAA